MVWGAWVWWRLATGFSVHQSIPALMHAHGVPGCSQSPSPRCNEGLASDTAVGILICYPMTLATSVISLAQQQAHTIVLEGLGVARLFPS